MDLKKFLNRTKVLNLQCQCHSTLDNFAHGVFHFERSQLSALRFLPMIIGSSTQTFYLEANGEQRAGRV